MEATSDTDTPLNLTQHNYFNLTGLSCEIAEHKLWINAREMLVIEKDSIPNGEIKHVNDTFYDFTTPKELKDADGSTLKIDNTLVLDNERKAEEPAAILESPDGQLTLKMWTDQPSVHGKCLSNLIDVVTF
jgi:aldose 1-epimerase